MERSDPPILEKENWLLGYWVASANKLKTHLKDVVNLITQYT